MSVTKNSKMPVEQAKSPATSVKNTKVQAYTKKNFKSNWSNTKTVYTRPR